MNRETFLATLSRIYALFGKGSVPPPVSSVLWERVADWPDGVLALVEQRLELAERLPANLYREFSAAWADWKAKNPQRVIRRHCPDCGDVAGFWCWKKGEKGDWTNFFSPCPFCQNGNGTTYPTPQELRGRGVIVMPTGYKGGPTAFDRDRGLGVLWPLGLDVSKPRQQMRVGVNMAQDPQRIAALTDAEKADVAAN